MPHPTPPDPPPDPGAAALDAALAHARASTGADWRAVCIARADPGDRAVDVLAAVAGIGAALVALALLPAANPSGESWDGLNPAARGLLATAAGVLGGLLAAAVAGRWSALRLLVTPPGARAAAATAAARVAFAADPPSAGDAPRVLVHAALAQRRVVVLADPTCTQQLGPDGLESLCRLAATGFSDPAADGLDDPLTALAHGVRAAAAHFADTAS